MLSYKKIIKKLLAKNISISVAESCTGGLVSFSFIRENNVSKIFELGMITYSNKSKINLLNVSKKKLNKYGAVSKEIIIEMVKNLYKLNKTKLCIATSGITGPKGGSKKKPVGLVFIGIKYKKNIHIIEKKYDGTRNHIQKMVVKDIFKNIDNLL